MDERSEHAHLGERKCIPFHTNCVATMNVLIVVQSTPEIYPLWDE